MWNRDQGSAIPYVILFTGLPAAGKTTLGHRVAAALNIPALGLDSIKESLFDSIGYSTPAWSKFLTLVSRDMAFRLLPNIGPCVFDIFISPEEARWRLLANGHDRECPWNARRGRTLRLRYRLE